MGWEETKIDMPVWLNVRGLCKEVGQYGWKEKEKSPMDVKLKNIISSLHLLIVVIYLLILYNWFSE